MSTKHHYTQAERDYHDAFTMLRLMRRISDVSDYYDPDRDPIYREARDWFDSLPPAARRAARRSLSAR
jgi:hypothetical protein